MRVRHIFICGLSGSTIFFHILINGTISEEKVTEHKCMFCTLFSEIFLFLIRIEGGMIINVYWSSCKVFLSDFNETWIFSTVIRKILQCKISWKFVQWEPSFPMRADRWTGRQTDRQTDRGAWRRWLSLFAILRMRLKSKIKMALSNSNLFPKCYRNQRKRVTLYWAILVNVHFFTCIFEWGATLFAISDMVHYIARISKYLDSERKAPGAICNVAFKYTNYHTNPFRLVRLAYLQKRLLYQGLSVSVNSFESMWRPIVLGTLTAVVANSVAVCNMFDSGEQTTY
jgi:hypothetical protein